MKTYSKYAEQFQKKKNIGEKTKFLPETETYQQFLEVQLEKVTNALLLTKDYEEKLQEMSENQQNFEQKIAKLTNLLKLMQNFTEAQEKENISISEKFIQQSKEINQRFDKFEKISNFPQIEIRLSGLEGQVVKMNEEKTEILKKIDYYSYKIDDLSSKLNREFSQEIGILDEKINNMKINFDFEKFREEINKKIELVMMEASKSFTCEDFEGLQKNVDNLTKEFESIFFFLSFFYYLDWNKKNYSSKDKVIHDDISKFNEKINQIWQEIDDLKYKTHLASQKNLKKNEKKTEKKDNHLDCVTREELYLSEKSLIDQFTRGFDRFGDIIKKYVSNQKNNDIKIHNIENKILDKNKKENNPFLSNIDEKREKSATKNTKFNEYLKNISDSSDLDELLIEKDMKKINNDLNLKKNIEKTPVSIKKVRNKFDSASRKNSKKREISQSNERRSKSASNLRKKQNLKPNKITKISPESKILNKKIMLERKERENRIKTLIKKEKKMKKMKIK